MARLAGQHLAPAAQPARIFTEDPWPTIGWLRSMAPDDDLWVDAKMDQVLRYMFANKHLASRPHMPPDENMPHEFQQPL